MTKYSNLHSYAQNGKQKNSRLKEVSIYGSALKLWRKTKTCYGLEIQLTPMQHVTHLEKNNSFTKELLELFCSSTWLS